MLIRFLACKNSKHEHHKMQVQEGKNAKNGGKKSNSLQNMKVVTQYELVPVISCSQLVVIIMLYRSITNVSIKLSL